MSVPFSRGSIPGGIVFLCWSLLAACGPAGATEPTETNAGDSLCLHFTGASRDIHIELKKDYSMNGTVPLTMCGIEPGLSYDLTVSGRGYEIRRGKFRLNEDGQPAVKGIRLGTMSRNAIVPGWGSIKADHAGSGWTDLLCLSALLYQFKIENDNYNHLHTRYEILHNLLESSTSFSARQQLTATLHESSREINIQNSYRKRLLYLTAGIYGFQLLDPWIVGIPPGIGTEAGGSIVDIHNSRKTRAKALLLSLMRPGRGQFYQGKNTRGVLFSTLTTVAGLYLLDYQNKYDQEVCRYEIEIEKYQTAASIAERNFHRNQALLLWSDVEDAKRNRNIVLITLAGLYGLNLFDTLFPLEDTTPPSNLSLEVVPNGLAMILKF
ncbi:MAG: hypothetical protein JXB45_10325 [Candidatus Krumholzibacteriota bacterium]|nr:hypothetical protein [Candidatus Krumholzibacteriota bacterium]